MGHIFISYKSDERDLAELVRQKLIDWHYTTWMDVHDIPPNADWTDEIGKALDAADRVVGIMTPAAMASYPVRREWETAIAKNKLLLLLFGKCPPHWLFDSIQRIDFTADRESAFDLLKTRLADPLPTSDEKRAVEPFYDYLQTLFDQVDQSLRTRIIATLRDERGAPTPIPLRSEITPDAVAASRPMLSDSLFVSAIKDEKIRTFTDFRGAFEHYKGRLLLLGEPGTGKTITLLHFAREALLRRLQDSSAPLPILRSIVMWDAYQRPALDSWIGDAYQNPALAAEIRAGHALLLLDGLDELGIERPIKREEPDGEKFDPRQRFLEAIAALVGANGYALPSIQILVTCRLKDYAQIGHKIALNGAVTLQPLDDAQIAAYLHGQPELLQTIMADDKLREVAQTPLLLSIFGFVYEGMTKYERAELANLQVGEILNTYIDNRYKDEEMKRSLRGGLMPFTLDELLEGLAILAAYMYMQTWKMYAISPASYLSEYEIQQASVNLELLRFAQSLGILDTNDHNEWRFIYDMRDMFAWDQLLLYLKSDVAERRLGSARALGFTKNWEAVSPLLNLLEVESDVFVRSAARASLDAIELENTIFISYRRKDWPIVLLLTQEFERILGARIFFDRDIDEPDFAKSLLRNLHSSRIFILIVTENTFIPSRIHSEDDWIQREIREALNEDDESRDKPIVLVQVNTPLPSKKDLPFSIRRVLDKQAVSLNQRSFAEDVDKLINFICQITHISRKHAKHTNKITVFADDDDNQ